MTLFDPDEGARRRDDAIDRVEEHSPPEWMVLATMIARQQAATGRTFTTDDVWEGLARLDVPAPPEARAMGAVMRFLALAGEIVPTGAYVSSARPECHRRPVAVWRRR